MTARIAVPEPTSTDEAYNKRSLPQYFAAIEAAGGTPVCIPLNIDIETQQKLVAGCAGILLPGSPADLDPERYGQVAVKETAAKDMPRETVDNLLLTHAFSTGKPLLGICYGLQSLNVWKKGTLIQHLPPPHGSPPPTLDLDKLVNHEPGRDVHQAHTVLLAPGSLLARLAGDTAAATEPIAIAVNSSHHQAIAEPGEMLKAVAVSPVDGIIEALEGANADQFVVAVQWHPERSYSRSATSRALFAAFLQAAQDWVPSGKRSQK